MADNCSHDGMLVEVEQLQEVRCEGCGEMWATVAKHFRTSTEAGQDPVAGASRPSAGR